MVIESCEYKHRAQIGCLLLASIPVFGIIIGVIYFFLLDWRHMQLLGMTSYVSLQISFDEFRFLNHHPNALLSLVNRTFGIYSLISRHTFRLIPESRRWYVNSHRVSRVNKLLQLCSNNKQSSTLGLNKIGSPTPSTIIYDKPILSQDALRVQTGSMSCLLMNQQLRTITCCLFILWFDRLMERIDRSLFSCSRFVSSFCYRCTFFPLILPHPTMNYVLMNATEFFSFIFALIVAYKYVRKWINKI